MRRQWLGVLIVVCVPLAACTGDDDTGGSAGADATITVFAAASLTDAFTEIGTAFEAATPGTTVEFNFAGSSSLREQILAGAPADVFASANESNMAQLVEAGALDGQPQTFATNRLQIAVPPGNPGDVAGLGDLARPDLLIGLCAEEVPCGQFGREALANGAVEPSIDTNEPDVRSLLTKIEAGELDAGIVYHSDIVAAAGRVDSIEIPDDQNVVATYPIAVLSEAEPAETARAFVDYVLSGDGVVILQKYGFTPP